MAPVQSRDQGVQAPPAGAGRSMPDRPAPDADAVSYTVQRGDTVYSIAWRAGADFRDLARWNNIDAPYLIIPGQVLRLHPPRSGTAVPGHPPSSTSAIAPPTPAAGGDEAQSIIAWTWPTSGTLLRGDSPTSRNGIDIAGQRGQSIRAAAPGLVVYCGSGLLGYGRLIIVKHSDTYLSAYAHNDTLLVKEGEQVSSGQRIATMGIGNGGKPLLHFEIRKDGKPVNPLEHLPRVSS